VCDREKFGEVVKQKIQGVVNLFKINFTAINADIIIDRKGDVRIIEVEFALSDALDLIPRAYGYNLLDNVLRVYLNQQPEASPKPRTAAGIGYLVWPRSATVPEKNSIKCKSVAELVDYCPGNDPRVIWEVGDDEYKMQGRIIAEATDQKQVLKLIEKARSILRD